MLVLTRARDEEIRIGDEIVVRVLDVKGERVRIGIAAPADIPVHRQEVYLEIERANRESLNVEGSGLKQAQELLTKRPRAKAAHPLDPPRRKRKATGTEVRNGA